MLWLLDTIVTKLNNNASKSHSPVKKVASFFFFFPTVFQRTLYIKKYLPMYIYTQQIYDIKKKI